MKAYRVVADDQVPSPSTADTISTCCCRQRLGLVQDRPTCSETLKIRRSSPTRSIPPRWSGRPTSLPQRRHDPGRDILPDGVAAGSARRAAAPARDDGSPQSKLARCACDRFLAGDRRRGDLGSGAVSSSSAGWRLSAFTPSKWGCIPSFRPELALPALVRAFRRRRLSPPPGCSRGGGRASSGGTELPRPLPLRRNPPRQSPSRPHFAEHWPSPRPRRPSGGAVPPSTA